MVVQGSSWHPKRPKKRSQHADHSWSMDHLEAPEFMCV
uniref:Uncharacterized protein n=1 Tax=Arundo donax TaxID=35708 RepID=A0A0A9BNG8_ARUDO